MTESASKSAHQLLTDQIEILGQLNDTLKREYDVLSTNKPEGLQGISDQKINLLQDLEVLNRSWQEFLKGQGAEFSIEGITRCVDALDPKKQLKLVDMWQQLGELSKACQTQNQVNGAVVTLRQTVTKQALDILRGQTLGGSVYDNTGSKRSSGGLGNTIAKA